MQSHCRGKRYNWDFFAVLPSDKNQLDPPATSAWRDGVLVALFFVLTAFALATVRPLWVDEILQLTTTTQPSVKQALKDIPMNRGASPLGYLVQQAVLQVMGYSLFWARFPQVLFAGGAVFIVALIAGRLGFRRPWMSAALFALLPLTLRYADESRVYAPALFFSVLSTYVYLLLTEKPSAWLAVAYTAVLTAAFYTQPYSASVALAHALWSWWEGNRKTAMIGFLAPVLAGVLYLPWYLSGSKVWNSLTLLKEDGFNFTLKTPLMILHEIIGAGYWGTGLLLILIFFAMQERTLGRSRTRLLALLITVPIVAGLLVDAAFGYFIAIRQFLWALPALALICAPALEAGGLKTLFVASMFAVVSAFQSYKYFADRSEDWRAAAILAEKEIGSDGCFLSAPPNHLRYYAFEERALEKKACGTQPTRVVLAISPYTQQSARQEAIDRLLQDGYVRQKESEQGKFSVVSFVWAK